MSKKVRRYHAMREVFDSKNQKHTILVYGELTQTNDEKGFILAPITYKKKDKNNIVSLDDKYVVLSRRNDLRPTREFNFGWAICSADDEFDLAKGAHLAEKRFSDSPMTTTDVRFFSDDMIAAILKNELDFIEEHLLEKYIPCRFREEGQPFGCKNKEKELELEIEEDENGPYVSDDACKCKNSHSAKDCNCRCHEQNNNLQETEEELPNIRIEAKEQKNGFNFEEGDFVEFVENCERIYGIVRNVNNGSITFYWELKDVEDEYGFNYTFETNRTREIKNINIKYVASKNALKTNELFNLVNTKLNTLCGYKWDVDKQKLLFR